MSKDLLATKMLNTGMIIIYNVIVIVIKKNNERHLPPHVFYGI